MALTVEINGRVVDAAPGLSLFDCAERAGVRVPTSCQKQGKCRECLVEVEQGAEHLSGPAQAEKHLKGAFRLSCRTLLTGGDGHVRCHTMRRGEMRIEGAGIGITFRNGRLDPAVTRRGDRVFLDGAEIDRWRGGIHGIAMDLGTTTVVLRLFNLEDGELIADTSFENPQRFAGSDVMARIQYDTENPGKLLRRTLAGYLGHAIRDFPVDPSTIYEMVVVGNSTMRDLFFRQSVYSIGQSPYRSITEIEMAEGRRATTSIAETGRRCLLPIHPRARVYGAPIISGHVGADAAACMIAAGLGQEDRLVAIMDIGTNTELIVGNRRRILAASCPAGPAFEGGAIACGMPALAGAIERVWADDRGGWRYSVVGDCVPQGICGSGLVTLLSELLRTGRMNERGRFEEGGRISIDEDHGVFLLESDVNELAQAKGANIAGLQVVFGNYGAAFEDVEMFYLAGGFGRHLDLDAAARIGLIPRLRKDRVRSVGNASIEGASMILLSRSKRDELETLVRRVEHCRLETDPHFFDYFVDGCQFAPAGDTDRASV